MNDGPKYKLFFWDDVLENYGTGVMFAIARDLQEAKQLILAHMPCVPEHEFEKECQIIEGPFGFAMYGSD